MYRCRVVYAKNKSLTVPVTDARTAEDAARQAGQSLKKWLNIEVWHGCDRVFVHPAPVVLPAE